MTRRLFLRTCGAASLAAAAFPDTRPATGPRAWKFAVMADTQWRNHEEEPSSCATHVIDLLNQQFIHHGVAFVAQVGDLVNNESVRGTRSLPIRAAHATPLYRSGIAFFPVRGNHESSATAAAEMQALFPQMLGAGPHLFGATNVNSPVLVATPGDPRGARLKGLSYSVDFRNVRCIFIDQFTRMDGSGRTNDNALDQMAWLDEALASKPTDQHAFVFSHKNLAGQHHKDGLFGASASENATARDTFISSLHSRGVRLHLSGHDHLHHRSVVRTSNGSADICQLICASNSSKFYTPEKPDDNRETPVSQELFTIGYYIFTIDGPKVNVDFYSSSHGDDYGEIDLSRPPRPLTFFHRESFGYSLNGRQFIVPRGAAYTGIQDAWGGSSARILCGANTNTEVVHGGRKPAKVVNTGWSPPPSDGSFRSDVLTLWGLADNLSLHDEKLGGALPDTDETRVTDTYSLALSFDLQRINVSQLKEGKLVLASRSREGKWVPAVKNNYGRGTAFIYGPWRPEYSLGAYGVDREANRVWRSSTIRASSQRSCSDFAIRLTTEERNFWKRGAAVSLATYAAAVLAALRVNLRIDLVGLVLQTHCRTIPTPTARSQRSRTDRA